jgi:FkbM family methyltransferase
MMKKLLIRLVHFLINRIDKNKEITRRLVFQNREFIVGELYKYPSFINTGHLHFERLESVANYFGFSKLDGVILDVGGADGVTAIMLSKMFPNARVSVFEPLKENIEIIKNNLKGHHRINLYGIAVGSVKQECDINVTHRITSSSLLDINESDFDDDYMSSQLKPKNSQKVSVDTIDNLFGNSDRVLVLKMDVQGFELEVLKGAKETLANTCLILTEMQNHTLYRDAPMYHEIDRYLRENNFTLLQFIPSLMEKQKQLEWDAIYVNNKFFS